MALFSITTLAAQQVPEVFSLRKIVLQADTDKAGFSKEVNLMNKELQTHGEGVGIALWEGDRGERSGELVHTWMFSTTERRNFLFPHCRCNILSKPNGHDGENDRPNDAG